MARPARNTVDYFPFYCEEGKKMFYIEEKYGNDGFAVFVKLLRELSKTENHYLDLSNKTTKMFLSAKCKVSVEVLEGIISDLVELGKFDFVLWSENSIIWCQDFVDSIEDAYTKRRNKCIDYNSLLLLLEGLGVRKPSKSNWKPSKSNLEGVGNPQIKEKKRKEEYTHPLAIWVSSLPTVSKMKNPLTDEQAVKLLDEYSREGIHEIFEAMDNYKPLLKNNNSAYLTFVGWVKVRRKTTPQFASKSKGIVKTIIDAN